MVLSSDGKLIAAAVGGSLYLLDAFQGAVKARFATGRPDQASAGFEPSFSPDSQYLSSGAACSAGRCAILPERLASPQTCFVHVQRPAGQTCCLSPGICSRMPC